MTSGHDTTTSSADRTDAQLMDDLTAAGGQDGRSLGELMVRHERLVLDQLRRHNLRPFEREDVAATVWERVWKLGRDRKWDAGRALHVSDPFVPLLKKMTKNAAMDFHNAAATGRKRRNQMLDAHRVHGEGWRTALAGNPSWKGTVVQPAAAGVPECLASAVASLPERLRIVYELHARGLTNRRISKEVGCSWGEVSRRLKKAREALAHATGTGIAIANRGTQEESA